MTGSVGAREQGRRRPVTCGDSIVWKESDP
jgi:hypothetical protein